MTAMLVPVTTEAEWLEARRKGIGASEIAIILGLAPPSWDSGSPFALYHQKLGNLPPPADSGTMERGRVLEPIVVRKFEELRWRDYYADGSGRELYAHPDRPWQMATPDRVLYTCHAEFDSAAPCTCGDGRVGVLEAKTTSSWDGWGEDGSDQIPVHYRCQVLWQCDVLSVHQWFVPVLNPGPWQFRIYEGTVDDAAWEDMMLMRAEGEAFMRRLAEGDPPDVDWRPATGKALRALHPAVEETWAPVTGQLGKRWLAACRAVKDAEARKSKYEHQIRDALGDARRAVTPDGQVVARRDVYPVKEHVRKAGITDRLVAVEPKPIARPLRKET